MAQFSLRKPKNIFEFSQVVFSRFKSVTGQFNSDLTELINSYYIEAKMVFYPVLSCMMCKMKFCLTSRVFLEFSLHGLNVQSHIIEIFLVFVLLGFVFCFLCV